MQKRNGMPINRWLILSLAVLFACTNVVGQDAPKDARTATFLNGRLWEVMDKAEKRVFLVGLLEGMRKGATELNLHQNKSEEEYQAAVHTYVGQYYAWEFTYEDHITELDALYADKENIFISIPEALEYCAVKLRGTRTKVQLEQYLIGLRQLASILNETKH